MKKDIHTVNVAYEKTIHASSYFFLFRIVYFIINLSLISTVQNVTSLLLSLS